MYPCRLWPGGQNQKSSPQMVFLWPCTVTLAGRDWTLRLFLLGLLWFGAEFPKACVLEARSQCGAARCVLAKCLNHGGSGLIPALILGWRQVLTGYRK